MSQYLLKILVPEKKIYEDEVVSLVVECENGPLTVLAGHAPMTALLVDGAVVLKTETETFEGMAGRGVLLVERNVCVVMTHAFSWAGNESVSASDSGDTREADSLL